MINNQIQSPVTGKNSAISGNGAEESKREAGKQGGLFKLLMNSIQGGELGEKKGQTSGANFLGGNLTLKTQNEGDGEQSAHHLLAGSGEGSKEEKITLSKLLEGSGSAVETTDAKPSNEEVEAETATDSDENSSETKGKKVISKDASTNGERQTDSETATDATTQSDSEAQSQIDGNTTQSDETIKNTDGEESVPTATKNSSATSDQVTTSGKIASEQQGGVLSGEAVKVESESESESKGLSQQTAAPSGEADKAGSESNGSNQQTAVLSGETVTSKLSSQGSTQQATTGNSKESNPLNGLVTVQESEEKGKQAGNGAFFTGEKMVESEGLAEGRSRVDGNSSVRPELVKSEGRVNELRALAAAQTEQLKAGQQQRRVPTEQQNESPDTGVSEDGALIQEIFSALQNGSIEQVAAEIRSLKASQLRETKYSNYLSSFANRQEITNSGSALNSGSGSSTSATAAGSKATMIPVSTMVPTGASVSSEMFDENGAVLWKEQITEYFESNEKSAAENQAAAAFARLGDVPVTNISVRRSFAQGISQAILNTTGNGKKGSEVWQKHNFILEDGKNVQVSAREVEGVLHLKLSSSFTELNKLLMEHENEIRDLLENELELKIDLQMDSGGDGNVADFFGGSSGQQSGSGNGPLDLGSLKKTKEQTIEEVVPKAVRKFGYNKMEWTV